ncbi:MAG: hypothetical protein ABNH26_08785 [Celeribacter sp.]|jgi:hypothetical protein
MSLPPVQIRITGNADDGVSETRRASRELDKLSASSDRVRRSTGSMQRGVQNAAYQVGDFAVQMAAGTSASRAMAMQLPQLLGGFGMLGAVMGAAVAIAFPLRSAMQGITEDGGNVARMFGTLEPAVLAISQGIKVAGEMFHAAAEIMVNNLDRIIITAGVAAAFFGGKWVAGFVAARVATFSLSAALVALRGALIRTGIGAVIVAAGELVYQFTRLSTAAGGFGEALRLVGNVALEVWQRIGNGVGFISNSVAAMSSSIQATFIGALNKMAGAFIEFTWQIAEGMNAIFPSLGLSGADAGITQTLAKMQMDAEGQAQGFAAAAQASKEAMLAPIESIKEIRDLLTGMKEERITLPSILGIGDDEEDGGAGGGKGGKEKKTLDEKLTDQENRIKEHLDRIKALTKGTLSDKLGAWGDYFGNLTTLTGTSSKKMLAIVRGFNAAQALMDAWGAYTKVLNSPEPMPWYARLAAAGSVLAAGLGAVDAIKSATESGSSGSASSASASSAAATPQNVMNANISLVGEGNISRSSVRDLFATINQGLDDGYVLGSIRVNG